MSITSDFKDVRVERWRSDAAPTESAIRALMSADDLQPYQWANGPGDLYSAHHHDYNKVIYIVRGSITFGLPDRQSEIALEAGDRLELPAGVRHEARVGPDGVLCLEA